MIYFQEKGDAEVGRDGGLEVVVVVGHQERTASSLSQNSTSQNDTGSIFIFHGHNLQLLQIDVRERSPKLICFACWGDIRLRRGLDVLLH